MHNNTKQTSQGEEPEQTSREPFQCYFDKSLLIFSQIKGDRAQPEELFLLELLFPVSEDLGVNNRSYNLWTFFIRYTYKCYK